MRILALVVASIGMLACGSSSSTSPADASTAEAVRFLSVEQPPTIVTALRAGQTTETKAATGHHFWAVRVGFDNNRGKVAQPMSLAYFSAETSPASATPLAPLPDEGSCGNANANVVQPGSYLVCYVVFDVVDDHPPVTLRFDDGKQLALSATVPAGVPGTL